MSDVNKAPWNVVLAYTHLEQVTRDGSSLPPPDPLAALPLARLLAKTNEAGDLGSAVDDVPARDRTELLLVAEYLTGNDRAGVFSSSSQLNDHLLPYKILGRFGRYVSGIPSLCSRFEHNPAPPLTTSNSSESQLCDQMEERTGASSLISEKDGNERRTPTRLVDINKAPWEIVLASTHLDQAAKDGSFNAGVGGSPAAALRVVRRLVEEDEMSRLGSILERVPRLDRQKLELVAKYLAEMDRAGAFSPAAQLDDRLVPHKILGRFARYVYGVPSLYPGMEAGHDHPKVASSVVPGDISEPGDSEAPPTSGGFGSTECNILDILQPEIHGDNRKRDTEKIETASSMQSPATSLTTKLRNCRGRSYGSEVKHSYRESRLDAAEMHLAALILSSSRPASGFAHAHVSEPDCGISFDGSTPWLRCSLRRIQKSPERVPSQLTPTPLNALEKVFSRFDPQEKNKNLAVFCRETFSPVTQARGVSTAIWRERRRKRKAAVLPGGSGSTKRTPSGRSKSNRDACNSKSEPVESLLAAETGGTGMSSSTSIKEPGKCSSFTQRKLNSFGLNLIMCPESEHLVGEPDMEHQLLASYLKPAMNITVSDLQPPIGNVGMSSIGAAPVLPVIPFFSQTFASSGEIETARKKIWATTSVFTRDETHSIPLLSSSEVNSSIASSAFPSDSSQLGSSEIDTETLPGEPRLFTTNCDRLNMRPPPCCGLLQLEMIAAESNKGESGSAAAAFSNEPDRYCMKESLVESSGQLAFWHMDMLHEPNHAEGGSDGEHQLPTSQLQSGVRATAFDSQPPTVDDMRTNSTGTSSVLHPQSVFATISSPTTEIETENNRRLLPSTSADCTRLDMPPPPRAIRDLMLEILDKMEARDEREKAEFDLIRRALEASTGDNNFGEKQFAEEVVHYLSAVGAVLSIQAEPWVTFPPLIFSSTILPKICMGLCLGLTLFSGKMRVSAKKLEFIVKGIGLSALALNAVLGAWSSFNK